MAPVLTGAPRIVLVITRLPGSHQIAVAVRIEPDLPVRAFPFRGKVGMGVGCQPRQGEGEGAEGLALPVFADLGVAAAGVHFPGIRIAVLDAGLDGAGLIFRHERLGSKETVEVALADLVALAAVKVAVGAVGVFNQVLGPVLAVVADLGETLGDEGVAFGEGVSDAVEEVLQEVDGGICAVVSVFLGGVDPGDEAAVFVVAGKGMAENFGRFVLADEGVEDGQGNGGDLAPDGDDLEGRQGAEGGGGDADRVAVFDGEGESYDAGGAAQALGEVAQLGGAAHRAVVGVDHAGGDGGGVVDAGNGFLEDLEFAVGEVGDLLGEGDGINSRGCQLYFIVAGLVERGVVAVGARADDAEDGAGVPVLVIADFFNSDAARILRAEKITCKYRTSYRTLLHHPNMPGSVAVGGKDQNVARLEIGLVDRLVKPAGSRLDIAIGIQQVAGAEARHVVARRPRHLVHQTGTVDQALAACIGAEADAAGSGIPVAVLEELLGIEQGAGHLFFLRRNGDQGLDVFHVLFQFRVFVSHLGAVTAVIGIGTTDLILFFSDFQVLDREADILVDTSMLAQPVTVINAPIPRLLVPGHQQK